MFSFIRKRVLQAVRQRRDLRDNYQRFLASGYQLLGVSADNAKRQQNFKEKNNLPFPLIADTERKVIRLLVFGVKKSLWVEPLTVFFELLLLSTRME